MSRSISLVFIFIYEKTADDEAETGTRVARGMGQGKGIENLVEVLFCPVIVLAISFPALRERVVFHTYSRGAVLFAKQLVRRMIIASKDSMLNRKWKMINQPVSLMWMKTTSNFQLPTASRPTAGPRCAPQFLHQPVEVSVFLSAPAHQPSISANPHPRAPPSPRPP